MFFYQPNPTTKEIILEAIRGKISRSTYMRISRIEEVETIKDLMLDLTAKEYEDVCNAMKEAFAKQIIWYIVSFNIVMDKDPTDHTNHRFDLNL